MPEQNLYNSLYTYKKMGKSNEEIKQLLLNDGYSLTDVESSLKSATQTPVETLNALTKKWMKPTLVTLGLLFIVGAGAATYVKFSDSEETSHKASEIMSEAYKNKALIKIAEVNNLKLEKKELDVYQLKGSAEEKPGLPKVEKKLPKLPSPLINQTTDSPEVELKIETSKDTYWLNEPFEGKFNAIAKKDEKNPYIVFEFYEHEGAKVGSIYGVDGDAHTEGFSEPIKAFLLREDEYSSPEIGFKDPGEYTMTFKAYRAKRCADLKIGDYDCNYFDLEQEDLIDFTPIATISKTITVLPEEFNPQTSPVKDEIENLNDDKTSLLDCLDSQNPTCMSPFLDKFTENLTTCTPSTGDAPIGFEPSMGLLRGYQIKGYENNNCVLDFWFVEPPEQKIPLEARSFIANLLDKKMTCKLTKNQLDIQNIADLVGCEGPLKIEMDKM